MTQQPDLPERRHDQDLFHLRPYAAADEEAAIALWLATWQATYPQFDFAARLSWWREHWRKLTAAAKIVIAADAQGTMIGFVTIAPATHYLDQLVVAPDFWGKAVAAALLDEAKRYSPDFIDLDVNTDNARAIGFYRKQGFVVTGDGVNALSGRPVHHMRWRRA